ncbi:uncharacterized protein N7483_011278 [Penicillium malachiteum]|uniref:uncharacterized protein n=1 Tax=Penicillium malachiteum TaxID=1324776 RepID=UPI00254844F4|nr:uncharacterized protein N7483_011278 [Penicillium malachiteum]KAJ5714097.1 hypothetical protein N7483_011278 [Penicillium malachiteum]
MTESRESQLSLLPEEEDLVTVHPNRSWNPLGRRGSAIEPDYAYALDHYNSRESESLSFTDEVLRDVGLGISNDSGHTFPPRGKRDSYLSSESSQPNTPGFLKTPLGTPGFSASKHLPNCPSRSTVLQRRFGWVPISMFILALYATIWSGIYLIVAFVKPRWTTVGTGLSMSASTANLLCAFFAKTIELAYVTICVAFIGQVLSRRALTKDSRGITISDMSMRSWIMQPGSMFVRWEAVRYSAMTFLGLIALTSTIVAMLYTTAAEALVSPKLNPGQNKSTILWGQVQASFANEYYLKDTCQSPIPGAMDPSNRNNTCLSIEHAGAAYHNYQQWIQSWTTLLTSGNDTSNKLANRPKPTGSMWDNTTITGTWIELQNITELSKVWGRMVNNITMAFPHTGIPAAAMDEKNGICQPQPTSGEGKYSIEASVPSPAINVLCAGMNKSELAPMVYTTWPDGSANFNSTTWSNSAGPGIPLFPDWLNSTVVDSLFGFGPKYGQRPPVFGTYPEEYNTIINVTGYLTANAVYLLGKPEASNPEYVMCAIRAKLTGVCSTSYDAESSGASLYTNCEDSSNKLQYDKQVSNFVEGDWSSDWKNVANDWATALNLGSGITDSDASNERLIMQMMPSYDSSTNTYTLNPDLPSISEALAVMSGCTAILGTQHTPFVQGWNYTVAENILPEPVYQHFTAKLQVAAYQSGGTEGWQNVFFVVLVFAFMTSAGCLVFMIIEARGHQVTDFTEPQNLFALAVNSPQSSRLRGACGCGPEGNEMNERWFIGMEETDEHYYIRAKADGTESSGYARVVTIDEDLEDGIKPVSPAVNEFRRLSKRGSWLGKFY